jgi:hypothetical protein
VLLMLSSAANAPHSARDQLPDSLVSRRVEVQELLAEYRATHEKP